MLGVVDGVASALPAAAATTTIHYSYTDPTTTEVLSCGAVWTYSGEHTGRVIKDDGAGGFLKIIQQDYYPGIITYQGRTYTANDHQTDITTLAADDTAIGALNGHGLFTRFPRIGVVVSDTGQLVVDESTQQTLKRSAHSIPLDQPFDFDAAVCAALTGQTTAQ